MPKYKFSLDSFQILNTRARHNDTDTATFGICINYNGTPQVLTQSMGDVNNGNHATGQLHFDWVEVAATDAVLVGYYIVNAGNSSLGRQAAEKLVGSILQAGAKALATEAASDVIGPATEAAIASAIGGVIGTVVPGLGNLIGSLVGAAAGLGWGLLTANCDGPVAFGVIPFTGAQLAALTSAGAFTRVDYIPGIDSASGCGSNSKYNVRWSIHNATADRTLLKEQDVAIWVTFGGARFHVPDPATLSRLYPGVPIEVLAAGALDGVPVVPADGTLLREEDGAIWVVDGGARFGVPDMGTLNRLFAGRPIGQLWNGALNGIPGIPADGTLLREEDGAIWVIYGGAKFGVPDMGTLNRLFAKEPIFQLWNGALNGIPDVPADGTLLREESNPQTFVIQRGTKLPCSSAETGNIHVLWDGALARFPLGS